jgi:hypothetical protein
MCWSCVVYPVGLSFPPAAALPAGRQGSGHAPHSSTPLEHLDALLTGHVQCVVCAPDITFSAQKGDRSAQGRLSLVPSSCNAVVC